MDVQLQVVDLGVTEDLLNRFKSTAEEILAELFKTSMSEGGIEINSLFEGIDFDGGLCCRRKGSLSTLASSMETTNSLSMGV